MPLSDAVHVHAFHAIGLVGHGRFGAALGELMSRGRLDWRAYDATRPVPAAHAAADLGALAAASDLIVLAVPVVALDAALRSLRPWLTPAHTVIDVGSVKVGPCALLDRHLGATIAHVGTHPLFGPLSLARAEPLRTVLCPSPRHAAAARRVRALFESLGSSVVERSAEAHDRAMALTHVLAFFIAKGLIDIGAGEDLDLAPPSFRALAQAIDAVRADAGHLFTAIQRENPYAAASRERLLQALQTIDQRLAANNDAPAWPDETTLARPAPSADPDARHQLALLDAELAALHQRRERLLQRALQQAKPGESDPDT